MRIYFCGSIRGGRQDVGIYQRIVKKLEKYGTVLTEHVSHSDLTDQGEDAPPFFSPDGEKFIHDRDLKWLETSDVIVAEVTQPSLGVGYELGRAVAMQKKVLCLFRPSSGKALSAMIRGADDGSLFHVRDYTEEEVEEEEEEEVEGILEAYFNKLKSDQNVVEDGVCVEQLTLRSLPSISMDGPNVNWKVFELLQQELCWRYLTLLEVSNSAGGI